MNKNITPLICQISTTWLIDDIRDIKTCETKTDDYTNRRLGKSVQPGCVMVGYPALLTYLDGSVKLDNEGNYIVSSLYTSKIDEIHVSLDEENKCVVLSIFTQNTIYILHADIDISGTNVAVIDDIIQNINEELEGKND